MKVSYGITGAALLAILAFLLPGTTGPIWTSLVYSMIVIELFFIGLIVYILRYSQTTGDRILGIGLLVVLSGLSAWSGVSQYQHAQWHDRLLTHDIRSSIDKGIITVHLNKPLLRTLEQYYQEENQQKRLEEIFHDRYGDHIERIEGQNRFIPEARKEVHRNDPPYLYYDSTDTPDHIRLVGQSMFGNGQDAGFENYNETKGNLQFSAELTKEGITYDRAN